MDSINSNQLRVGNFTSSEIVALTEVSKDGKSFGVPALTYIHETNLERKLGRSLTDEVSARPLSWGTLCERRVNEITPTNYVFKQNQTISHPTIKCFKGSPDGEKPETVVEIKSPMTLKSFCTLVSPIYDGLTGMSAMLAIMNGYVDDKGFKHPKHKDGEKYYWQIVSNSILTGSKYAELIVYLPYKSELQEIRELAGTMDDQNLYKYYWIVNGNDEELPFLVDGGYYRNLNTILFEVPEADKQLLLSKICEAEKMLIDFPASKK